uniref:non-specific serine/threonine protein kinase n=1 Tax=Salix viminalis TaxID=40686 RepID=A0A6N2LYW7_SALVM
MSCSSSSASEEDEEGIDSYRKGGYHAVRVGDQFSGGRYIAQRKLGLGPVFYCLARLRYSIL